MSQQTKTLHFDFEDGVEAPGAPKMIAALMIRKLKAEAEKTEEKESEKGHGILVETRLKTSHDSERHLNAAGQFLHHDVAAKARLSLTFIRLRASAGQSRPSLEKLNAPVERAAPGQMPKHTGKAAAQTEETHGASTAHSVAKQHAEKQGLVIHKDEEDAFTKALEEAADNIPEVNYSTADADHGAAFPLDIPNINQWQMDYLKEIPTQVHSLKNQVGLLGFVGQLNPTNMAFRLGAAEFLELQSTNPALSPQERELADFSAQEILSPNFVNFFRDLEQELELLHLPAFNSATVAGQAQPVFNAAPMMVGLNGLEMNTISTAPYEAQNAISDFNPMGLDPFTPVAETALPASAMDMQVDAQSFLINQFLSNEFMVEAPQFAPAFAPVSTPSTPGAAYANNPFYIGNPLAMAPMPNMSDPAFGGTGQLLQGAGAAMTGDIGGMAVAAVGAIGGE